jgi:hypothetical protein
LAGVIATFFLKKTSTLSKCQTALSCLWVLGLGREASAENYYLEFSLFGLYFLGEGWLGEGSRSSKTSSFISLGSLWHWAVFAGVFSLMLLAWPQAPNFSVERMKSDVLPLYQQPGECLSLDVDLPVMAGKRVWIQPLEYTHMVEKGAWSVAPLLEDIRGKKFASVELYDIPRQYLLPQTAVDEIEKNYKVVFRAYGRKWYRPKP